MTRSIETTRGVPRARSQLVRARWPKTPTSARPRNPASGEGAHGALVGIGAVVLRDVEPGWACGQSRDSPLRRGASRGVHLGRRRGPTDKDRLSMKPSIPYATSQAIRLGDGSRRDLGTAPRNDHECAGRVPLTPGKLGARAAAATEAIARSADMWALRGVSLRHTPDEVVGSRPTGGEVPPPRGSAAHHGTTGGHRRNPGQGRQCWRSVRGFHPELSGRDNSYLTGAILGMNRARSPASSTQLVEFARCTAS